MLPPIDRVVPEQCQGCRGDARGSGLGAVAERDELERFRAIIAQTRIPPVPLEAADHRGRCRAFRVASLPVPGVEVFPTSIDAIPTATCSRTWWGYVGRIGGGRGEARSAPLQRRHAYRQGRHRALLRGSPHGQVASKGRDQCPRGARCGCWRAFPRSRRTSHASIDADMQQAMVDALEGHHGAAVAIDPRNGEVLGMVRLPRYDRIPSSTASDAPNTRTLLKAPGGHVQRVLMGGYEPARRSSPSSASRGWNSAGAAPRTPRCRRVPTVCPPRNASTATGVVAVTDASTARSARAVGEHLLLSARVRVGIDRLSAFSAQSVRRAHRYRSAGDSDGCCRRRWKERNREEPWYQGETVISGIARVTGSPRTCS